MSQHYYVTTAVTAYERYTVEAVSEDEARQIVADAAQRIDLRSMPWGHGDDEAVIDIRLGPCES